MCEPAPKRQKKIVSRFFPQATPLCVFSRCACFLQRYFDLITEDGIFHLHILEFLDVPSYYTLKFTCKRFMSMLVEGAHDQWVILTDITSNSRVFPPELLTPLPSLSPIFDLVVMIKDWAKDNKYALDLQFLLAQVLTRITPAWGSLVPSERKLWHHMMLQSGEIGHQWQFGQRLTTSKITWPRNAPILERWARTAFEQVFPID
jgi:hypothetical protein